MPVVARRVLTLRIHAINARWLCIVSAACKKKHRKKHEKECERRVTELHYEKLFKQPPHLEDCPICMIRLPMIATGRTYMNCCGKVICNGCVHAVQTRAEKVDLCPFCRVPAPISEEEMIKRFEKRAELNDSYAIYLIGCHCSEGRYGKTRNYATALGLWHRAGDLSYASAYYAIGNAYKFGNGVEVDEKKAKHYYELAAMGGDAIARNILGAMEAQAGNWDRALRHWMIGVKDGYSNSLRRASN